MCLCVTGFPEIKNKMTAVPSKNPDIRQCTKTNRTVTLFHSHLCNSILESLHWVGFFCFCFLKYKLGLSDIFPYGIKCWSSTFICTGNKSIIHTVNNIRLYCFTCQEPMASSQKFFFQMNHCILCFSLCGPEKSSSLNPNP